jgi:hypothetical protein
VTSPFSHDLRVESEVHASFPASSRKIGGIPSGSKFQVQPACRIVALQGQIRYSDATNSRGTLFQDALYFPSGSEFVRRAETNRSAWLANTPEGCLHEPDAKQVFPSLNSVAPKTIPFWVCGLQCDGEDLQHELTGSM